LTRKIDLYCDGDCWNPKLWSATPYEIVTTMKEFESLNNTYDIYPFENENSIYHYLQILPYLRIDKRGLFALRGLHPSYYQRRQKKALEIYNSNPKPDSILTIGHLAIFDKTPYFLLQDIDVNMVIKWKEERKTTYLFDRYSVSTLKKSEKIQQEVYENASGIFTSSEWIKNNICSYIDEPQKIFAMGIGHPYSKIQITEETLIKRFENPVLLFVGNDGIRNGVDIVIEVFKQVKNELKNIKLKIVTSVERLPKQTKKLINNLPDIELYNNVEPEELAEFYLSSSLFVMPSRFEPFGKVFIEAMAFGLPVIGANSCAMPEFIIDDYNGYTLSVNPEEIENKIRKIFSSFRLYKKFSNNAKVMSNKYTEENVVKEMLYIIDKYTS
jgi:glycosyltransferase involved in cell wall biosynthesis